MEDELAQLERMFRELQNHPRVMLNLSPYDAWTFIGMIQLALRHPGNTGKIAESVKSAMLNMQDAMQLSDEMKEWLNRGWQPEHDREITELGEFVTVKTEDFMGLSLAFEASCKVTAMATGSTYEEVEKAARLRGLQIFESSSEAEKVNAMKIYYESLKNDH